jgi:hypothetical protein
MSLVGITGIEGLKGCFYFRIGEESMSNRFTGIFFVSIRRIDF